MQKFKNKLKIFIISIKPLPDLQLSYAQSLLCHCLHAKNKVNKKVFSLWLLWFLCHQCGGDSQYFPQEHHGGLCLLKRVLWQEFCDRNFAFSFTVEAEMVIIQILYSVLHPLGGRERWMAKGKTSSGKCWAFPTRYIFIFKIKRKAAFQPFLNISILMEVHFYLSTGECAGICQKPTGLFPFGKTLTLSR